MTTSRTTRLLLLATLVLWTGLPACSASAPPPPAKTLTQRKAERDPNSERERPPERRLIAPPPAYGNKVVFAQAVEPDNNG